MGSKRKKLRKQMRRRGLEDAVTLVICGGKKCAPRSETRPLIKEARSYAEGKPLHVVVVGCLHLCKKGPLVASYPKSKIKKRVDAERVHRMIDKLVL